MKKRTKKTTAKIKQIKEDNSTGLKNFLKTIKLNEEIISMVLGALVIVIVGILVVNYFKDKKGTTLPTAINTTAPLVKAEPGKSHTVKEGETLWSIAEDAYGSGYNWTDIYTQNKLEKEGLIAGQVLNIPQVSAKQPTITNAVATIAPSPSVSPIASATVSPTTIASPSATATVAPAETKAPATATSYTVAKGDSLWKIAVAQYGNGFKWVEIARANKLGNPNVIHAGNVLTLPR